MAIVNDVSDHVHYSSFAELVAAPPGGYYPGMRHIFNDLPSLLTGTVLPFTVTPGKGVYKIYDPVSASWVWPPVEQVIWEFLGTWTAPNDALLNEGPVLALPALGKADSLVIESLWDVTSSTNTKDVVIMLGSVGDMSSGQTLTVTNRNTVNALVKMQNMMDASVQQWWTNTDSIYGNLAGDIQTTGKATGTSKRLAFCSQKGAAAVAANEPTILKRAVVSIKGAGLPAT